MTVEPALSAAEDGPLEELIALCERGSPGIPCGAELRGIAMLFGSRDR